MPVSHRSFANGIGVITLGLALPFLSVLELKGRIMNRQITLAAAFLATCAVLGFGASSANAQTWKTYNPSLGTLPTSQGFTLVTDDTAAPAPFVSGNLLYQGPTTTNAIQSWQSNTPAPIDFNAGASMEAILHVDSSNYYNPGPGQQKSGYYLALYDHSGRDFTIGIDSAGITVNTDGIGNAGQGVARKPFDTTSAFHDYRLDVAGGVGTLSIDGAFFASTPVNDSGFPNYYDLALFGDGSYSGTSQTELNLFRYTVPAPEPTCLGLVAVGIGLLLRRRRGIVCNSWGKQS